MAGLAVSAIVAALGLLPDLSQRPAQLSEQDADLVLTATVQFDSITFQTTGTPRVEFTGTLIDKTEWTAERINLPEKLEPGVTYRNAGIRLRILATFKSVEAFLKGLEEQAQAAAPKPKGGGQ